jgi:hypothetical protein
MAPKRRKNQKKRAPMKNFQQKRRKVVETKRREMSDIAIRNSDRGLGTTFSTNYPDPHPTAGLPLSAGQSVTLLPLRSFYRMSRGNRKNQMIGNEIKSLSLYSKSSLYGLPANNSVEVFQVCGWIKDTLSLTQFTTPTLYAANRDTLETWILEQLKQHFDSANDEFRYREAKKDNILITKYRQLQHPKEAAYQDKVDFKGSWKTNRKVVYSPCASLSGSNDLITEPDESGNTIDMTDQFKQNGDVLGGDIGGFIPNNSWCPFELLYCPKPPSPGSVTFKTNNIHYFTG